MLNSLYKNEATVWGVWPEVSKPPSYEQLKWHCRSKSLEKSLCGPDRPLANAPLSLSSPRCTHVYWFCYNRLRNKSLAALGMPLTTQTLRRRRPPTLRCLRALQAGRQVAALVFFRARAVRAACLVSGVHGTFCSTCVQKHMQLSLTRTVAFIASLDNLFCGDSSVVYTRSGFKRYAWRECTFRGSRRDNDSIQVMERLFNELSIITVGSINFTMLRA
jgi:hypothetical protein